MMTERDITISLTEAEVSRIELATGELPYLLRHAESVFNLLYSLHAGGGYETHHRLVSLYELCARAFAAAAEKEGEAIAVLDRRLREAMAVRRQEQRAEREEIELRTQDFAAKWAAQGYRNPDDTGA